jgi:hypothetical protein
VNGILVLMDRFLAPKTLVASLAHEGMVQRSAEVIF